MKIECPCKDCTTETGRSTFCHDEKICEKWAKFKAEKTEQFKGLIAAKQNGIVGPIWTQAAAKAKADSKKRPNQRVRNMYTKGW